MYSVDVEQSACPWKDTCDLYVYIGICISYRYIDHDIYIYTHMCVHIYIYMYICIYIYIYIHNTWNDHFILFCLKPKTAGGEGAAPFISPWPMKLLMFGEDMQSDQPHVPSPDVCTVDFCFCSSLRCVLFYASSIWTDLKMRSCHVRTFS